MKRTLKRLLLSRARPVRCELCGEVLFKTVPILWKGRVKLVGAEFALVSVDFDSMNRLVFRHAEVGLCRGAANGRA